MSKDVVSKVKTLKCLGYTNEFISTAMGLDEDVVLDILNGNYDEFIGETK